MSERIWNVLFVCTGNSARSIMAESLMNHLGKSRFRAWSAGSFPKGEVNPNALKALTDMRLPVDGLRSKSWDEFAGPDAPALDLVFTVCDRAAGEVCPIWPGQPMTAHWGMPDPAEATGTPEQVERQFKDAVITLKRRIELLLALPVGALDRLALKREIDRIGRG
jgi:arsenate reductase